MEPSRRDLLCTVCALAVACYPVDPLPEPGDTDLDTDAPPDPDDTDTEPWSPCVVPGTAAEGWIEVPFTDHPGLSELYGYAYLSLQGRSIVIAQVEPDCFVALERPCTHEGEPIEYRPERNGFVCPRHGALYAWDGRVLAGPAPLDLRSFPCGPRDGAVWIHIE